MKKLALALSTATLVVGISTAMLWRQLHVEREQLAELRVSVTTLESAQTAARAGAAQSSAATGTLIASDSAVAPANSPEPATSPSPSPSPGLQQGLAKGIADVLSSPEGNDMIRNQVRAALPQQFPDLAAELRLTPAEADKFMDLLAKQASSLTGDALGMMTGGNGAAPQESQRKMIEAQLASEKEISRMLGNRYPAWQEYQGTAAARQQVTQLRGLLGTGQDALTEAQSRPLIAALGAEQARINKEEQSRMSTAARSTQPSNVLEEQLKSMTAQNERLLNTAASHLNTNQLDHYRRMLAQQENMVRTVMGGMNARGNAPAQGGAPR